MVGLVAMKKGLLVNKKVFLFTRAGLVVTFHARLGATLDLPGRPALYLRQASASGYAATRCTSASGTEARNEVLLKAAWTRS